jgi:GntR family transcriptional repressor for pyruvate dehydrogenase complex
MSDMSDLITVQPKTSRQVAEWLLRHIAEKALQPGDRLPSEHDLARSTGTGRSSVREALQLLAGQGLLEARPGKGYFLCRTEKNTGKPAAAEAPGIEEIQDLTEARIVIEGACAALAASRATPADVARIEAFLSAMEAKAASAASVYRDALTLHLMISEAAHNCTLSEMLRVIIPKIAAHGAEIAAEIPDHAAVDAALHRELWTKMRTGDPAVARAAMETHIRDAASLYRLPYESQTMQESVRRPSASPSSSEPDRPRKG